MRIEVEDDVACGRGVSRGFALTSVIYIWSVFDSDQHADAPAVAAGTEARDLRRVDAFVRSSRRPV